MENQELQVVETVFARAIPNLKQEDHYADF